MCADDAAEAEHQPNDEEAGEECLSTTKSRYDQEPQEGETGREGGFEWGDYHADSSHEVSYCHLNFQFAF